MGAGVGRDDSMCVDKGDLASVLPFKRIFLEKFLQNFLRAESLAQEVDSARSVTDVHVGLRGNRADTRQRPGHHRADGKLARSDRHAEVAVGRIDGDNGECGDVWRLENGAPVEVLRLDFARTSSEENQNCAEE